MKSLKNSLSKKKKTKNNHHKLCPFLSDKDFIIIKKGDNMLGLIIGFILLCAVFKDNDFQDNNHPDRGFISDFSLLALALLLFGGHDDL